MQPITRRDFAQEAARFDRLTLLTPDIDAFCSSSHWGLPASAALMPPGEDFLFRGEQGYVAALIRERFELRTVESLEAAWGLSCPLVGPDPQALVAGFVEACRTRESTWDLLFLTGIPVRSRLLMNLYTQLSARYQVGLGPITQRHVASLAGGVDGFLSRRSANFRRGLQRSLRRAAASGVEVESHDVSTRQEATLLYARILEIDRRTWKGRSGTGMTEKRMGRFYAGMIKRLAAAGVQRAVIARHEGQDVAYLLGSVWGSTWRGLQFGFDDRYRALGLGNAVLFHQLRRICEEGAITECDLGTGGEYKLRWTESTRDSVAVLARAG